MTTPASFRAAPRVGAAPLAGLAAGLLLAACGAPRQAPPPDPAGPPILDLAAALGAAGVTVERSVLELGLPAARSHLVSGWSRAEEDAGGPFAWSLGLESEIELFAVAPRDLEVGFLCRPFEVPEGSPQRLSVELNGHLLGEVALEPGFRRYDLEAPASAVASGVNRLRLRFAYSRRPSDVDPRSEDRRELAAACRWVAFGGLESAPPPRLVLEGLGGEGLAGEGVEIPAGAEAAYYFDADGPVELRVERLEGVGPRGSGLELVAGYRDAAGLEETRRFTPGAGPVRWRLPARGPAIARLTLGVVDRGGGPVRWLRERLGGGGERGLTLEAPRVVTAGAAPPAADDRPVPASPVNVVVYLIDTLRADHLGTYGYPRPVSPEIDRFAGEATVFTDAQAQSSWTRPAVASLFTGLDPRRHGIHDRRDGLAPGLATLAEVLSRAGYDTAGFVTNGNVAPAFGFDRGFATYRYLRESGETAERHRLSDDLNAWAFDWLERRSASAAPFFLYLHSSDPHAPYAPPEPWRRRFAPGADPAVGRLASVREIFTGGEVADDVRRGLIDLYDAEIAFNDHHFGRLLDRLRELELYDDSLIVLLSDHGEEFFDHGGWEHGKTLYGEQLRVPLIVKLPAGEGARRRIEGVARQVDVLPTILDVLGIPAPPRLDGASLLAPDPGRRSFAHLGLGDRQVTSVAARGFKLILDASPFPVGAPVQLFDTEADPGETVELAAERRFEGELLAQVLRRRELELASLAGAAAEIELPEELRRQLEALGYL